MLPLLKSSQKTLVDFMTVLYSLISNSSTLFMWFRSQDVLNVIGKILCFSEEQLRIVGLKHQPYSMLGTLYTSILSGPSEGIEVRPFPTLHTTHPTHDYYAMNKKKKST